jgi:uncharacterized protein
MDPNVKRFRRTPTMPMNAIQLLFLIGSLILLVCLFYPRLENFFIFYPEKTIQVTPEHDRIPYEEISFRAIDNVRLHGWYFPVDGDRPTILFCHGNAGNISHRLDNIRHLVANGFPVFIFDYRGYGRSEGRPSEKGLYKDGLAAYDFLADRKGLSSEGIVLFGRSLGVAVAVEIALQRPVRSLVLESGFTSTREMARSIALFRVFSVFVPRHFDNLRKLPLIREPKLIIHGTQDEIVPFPMGQELFDAALPPRYFYPIQGAGHNDTYVTGGPRYFKTLSAFIRDSKI